MLTGEHDPSRQMYEAASTIIDSPSADRTRRAADMAQQREVHRQPHDGQLDDDQQPGRASTETRTARRRVVPDVASAEMRQRRR